VLTASFFDSTPQGKVLTATFFDFTPQGKVLTATFFDFTPQGKVLTATFFNKILLRHFGSRSQGSVGVVLPLVWGKDRP